jgi:hypothetical protein
VISWLKKYKLGLFSASFLNAVFCVVATFWLLEMPAWNGAEKPLIQFSTLIKTLLLKWENKPPQKQFLFVDVAYSNQLIDMEDDGIPVGNQSITDRDSLATLLEILAQKPQNHSFIICDIFFEHPSQSDKRLEKALKKLPNIVLSHPFKENSNKENLPIFKKIPTGLAVYQHYDNSFLKYRLLYNDSLKTVPVMMYEYLRKKKFDKGFFFHTLGGKSILNHFVVSLPIRNYDLFQAPEGKRYNYLHLNELLMFPEDIPNICKGRIVVLGDFSKHDKHETIYGSIPGPLILVNTYLALASGENIITIPFVLYVLCSFWLLSFLLFRQKKVKETRLRKWLKETQVKYLIRFLTYAFGMGVISMTAYFVFNIHLNIFILALWFYALDGGLKYFYPKS